MGAPRFAPALCLVLGALLVASLVSAWVLGGRVFAGPAPGGSPRTVPAQGAGEPSVELSADAARHPASASVRDQLQRYFDAINARDYALWTTAVVAERVAAQPRAGWEASLRSSVDGTVRVDRIDPTANGTGERHLLVLLRFVSTQNVEDAPPQLPAARICWRGVFPMVGDLPRLETGTAGNLVSEAC